MASIFNQSTYQRAFNDLEISENTLQSNDGTGVTKLEDITITNDDVTGIDNITVSDLNVSTSIILPTSISVDTITEKTLNNGVDIETVHLEDGVLSNIISMNVDTITEKTLNNGVSIESIVLEDSTITTTGDLVINTGLTISNDGRISVTDDTFPCMQFQRNSTETTGGLTTLTGVSSAQNCITFSSGNIGTGFGGGLVFQCGGLNQTSAITGRLYSRLENSTTDGCMQLWNTVSATSYLNYHCGNLAHRWYLTNGTEYMNLTTSGLAIDNILEKTTNNGVIIDGLTIKDGGINKSGTSMTIDILNAGANTYTNITNSDATYYNVVSCDQLVVGGTIGAHSGRGIIQVNGYDNNDRYSGLECIGSTNAYPIMTLANKEHGTSYVMFDSFLHAGVPKSSSTASNFALRNASDYLYISASTGYALGNEITWTDALKVYKTGGVYIPGTEYVDTISEYTSTSGVTIDGMLCKDGSLKYSGNITIDAYNSGAASNIYLTNSDGTHKATTYGDTLILNKTEAPTGRSLLQMYGVNDSALHSGIEIIGSANTYPIMHISGRNHDDMSICFDCYRNDSTYYSSDAGSNYVIMKDTDQLRIAVSSGNTAGNTVASTLTAMIVNTSGVIFMPEVQGTTVSSGGDTLMIGDDGQLGDVASIRESKKNISGFNSDFIYDLKPVKFNYRKKDENNKYTEEYFNKQYYGLIAEEVEKVKNELCKYEMNHRIVNKDCVVHNKTNPDGVCMCDYTNILRSVRYDQLPCILLDALQKQNNEIKKLKNDVSYLKNTA